MKHFLSLLLFVGALCVCLWGLDHLMRRGDGQAKYEAFFDSNDPQAFDVFFLGTSHVMDAVYPNLLWRDYGFTSYNLGNAAEPMEATYWTLRLAMQYHVPRVVVIDVCYLDRPQGPAQATNHLFLDELPLTPLKLEAISSLFPKESWAEMIFPLVLYHHRWTEMMFGHETDMTDCPPFMYGSELRVGRTAPLPFTRITQTLDIESPGRDALRRIISLCEELEIPVALIAIPYPADADAQLSMNSASFIAEEWNVPFLNLFDVPDLVDFSSDCYDAGSHLNPDGAAKVTAYLGAWLCERFDLPDHRTDDRYASWDDALTRFEQAFHAQWLNSEYKLE
ncbi:MAG: hypothetical protein Q4G52_03115 [Clostridia bacterium]|nr:hypothetical protein [Clostridia bacterium]